MSIKVGDKIPEVTLRYLSDDGLAEVTTASLFGGKKVVMFGVPGAYTPTCTAQHLPSYLGRIDAFKEKNVDQIVCIAVNDPFVMKNWGDSSGVNGQIMMLSDGNAELTKAMGLELDGSGFGLGVRTQRFALVAEDGVVKHLAVESAPSEMQVSGADHVLEHVA